MEMSCEERPTPPRAAVDNTPASAHSAAWSCRYRLSQSRRPISDAAAAAAMSARTFFVGCVTPLADVGLVERVDALVVGLIELLLVEIEPDARPP